MSVFRDLDVIVAFLPFGRHAVNMPKFAAPNAAKPRLQVSLELVFYYAAVLRWKKRSKEMALVYYFRKKKTLSYSETVKKESCDGAASRTETSTNSWIFNEYF